MSLGTKLLWRIVLCVFLVGCGSYRTVNLQQIKTPEAYADVAGRTPIKAGDEVRVSYRNGTTVKERIVRLDRETLTFAGPSAFLVTGEAEPQDGPPRVVPLQAIEKIEYWDANVAGTIALVVLGCAVVVVTIGFIQYSQEPLFDANDFTLADQTGSSEP